MAEFELTPPRVVIEQLVKDKIMHWVNASEFEVSGLGKVIVVDGVIRVIDAILLPQKNGTASTDIEPEDVGKAMFLLKDTPGDLRFWWHSHVNMSVFWSGTDMDTIRKLGKPGWFVNTVFNKKNETRTAIMMGEPFPVFIDKLPLEEFRVMPSAEQRAAWDEEYKTNVTNQKRGYGSGRAQIWDKDGWRDMIQEDYLGNGEGRLSKKQLKRLMKKGGKVTGGGQQDTPQLTGTTGDDGPEPELPTLTTQLPRTTPDLRQQRCLICEMYPVSCNCPQAAKQRAEAYDDAGFCWCCEGILEQCICQTHEFNRYKDFFIAETARLGANHINGYVRGLAHG